MKLRRHAGSVDRRDIIEAIDDAQQDLWRRLVIEDRGWFTTASVSVTSITNGTRSYNLDEDFHQVYFIEATEAGKENVTFAFAAMSSDTFQKRRRSIAGPAATLTQFYYDVIDDNPAVMELAGGIPAALSPMTVQIFYVRRVDKVTAEADALDAALVPFLGPLACRAAAQIACGLGNSDLSVKLDNEWERSIPEISALASRQVADPYSTGSQRERAPQEVSTGGRF